MSPTPSPREESKPRKPAKARREAESPTASDAWYLVTMSQKANPDSPPMEEVSIRNKAFRYRGSLSFSSPEIMSAEADTF